MRLLALPNLYCLLITQSNNWNERQFLSLWSTCFGFFVCPCYSRITHYPALKKSGDQNITVCEKQGNDDH